MYTNRRMFLSCWDCKISCRDNCFLRTLYNMVSIYAQLIFNLLVSKVLHWNYFLYFNYLFSKYYKLCINKYIYIINNVTWFLFISLFIPIDLFVVSITIFQVEIAVVCSQYWFYSPSTISTTLHCEPIHNVYSYTYAN